MEGGTKAAESVQGEGPVNDASTSVTNDLAVGPQSSTTAQGPEIPRPYHDDFQTPGGPEPPCPGYSFHPPCFCKDLPVVGLATGSSGCLRAKHAHFYSAVDRETHHKIRPPTAHHATGCA
ncbi:uncharacterized protein DNG_04114 [Cephalotrichum gorgonifer]|uniref:Uncharacterized protein n=1 Tax=Cephalotrichum gorgonifer TaxID=2041049 RepID=A0AAE8SUW1_9PEZI|nr:uncharacterized protein DNG_04114 [Cephalotrichum gorgonifer]